VIQGSIVGNHEDRLLRFLADPKRGREALPKAGIEKEFRSQVDERYQDATTMGPDPAGWAREFVSSAMTLEVFDATGGAADLPFAANATPGGTPARHEGVPPTLAPGP